MGSDPRFHEPEWRRRSALATIGSARLRAGDPDGAMEAWRESGVGAIVGSGLKEMRDAGYVEEVAKYLETLEPEERAETEKSFEGSPFEDRSPGGKAPAAGRRAAPDGVGRAVQVCS